MFLPETAFGGVLAISRSYKPLSIECVFRCLVEVTFVLQNLVARYCILESDNTVPIEPIRVPIAKIEPQINASATICENGGYGNSCVTIAIF